jgi:acetyl esterase/lipase
MRSRADSVGVDPDRIAVAGGSAGGHMALCLASCPDHVVSPRVMAVVAFNPGVDIVSLQGGANILPAGTDPTAISPLHHVDALTSPVLIQHGTADQFFPIDGIRRFRDAAASCELIEYEGAAHGFFNRRVSEAHFESTTSAAVAFLRRIAEPQPG